MGNTCVGTGCCNPKSNGSSARKPLDKPFTDPSPGESFLMCSNTFFFESSSSPSDPAKAFDERKIAIKNIFIIFIFENSLYNQYAHKVKRDLVLIMSKLRL